MGNWLTFEPRRVRVAASKIVAATVGGLAIGAVGVALALLGSALVTAINTPPPGLPAAPPVEVPGGSLGLLLLRVVVICALAGLGGAVLGLLLRSTAGVIGAALGWLLVVEAYVGAVFAEGRLQPWLMRTNVEGFVNAGSTYFATTCGPEGCQMHGPRPLLHRVLGLPLIAHRRRGARRGDGVPVARRHLTPGSSRAAYRVSRVVGGLA